MTDDPDRVAAALRGTALDGHPVTEGLGGTMIVEGVTPADVLESWRAARSVLPVTGRWPVLTGAGELYHDDPEPETIDHTVDPWVIFPNWGDDQVIGRDELRWHVGQIAGVDLEARAAAELPLPTTRLAVEHWVWRTVLADPVLAAEGHRIAANYVGTAAWYTPAEVQLVLLPTPEQRLAPAWVSYYGAARTDGQSGLAAAIDHWERAWGAELVACWTTVLQFVVARPPAPGPSAWRLARQLKALGGNLDMPPWQLAFAVTRSDAWSLHDRP